MNYNTLNNKKVLYNPNIGEEAMDLLTLSYYEPVEYEYILFKIPHDYIARPDLISLDQYGSTDYVDVICKVNNISNPFEVNEGMLLIIPEPAYVGLFKFEGDNIEASAGGGVIGQSDSKDIKPSPKAKQEPRKPNEAVIGDKRYKIDKDRRVVIY